MPAYDFLCRKCGRLEETCLVKNSSEVVLCETCKEPMEKQFPHSNFYLKGSGWGKHGYTKQPKQQPPVQSD